MKDRLNYPNPAFIREDILNFEDGWEVSLDKKNYSPVNVPFSLESPLSGITVEKAAFLRECHYKKTFNYENKGKNVLIRFGAVDHRAVLFLNGNYVGMHVGGYTSFCFDITKWLVTGENLLELDVYDAIEENKPRGKQSYEPLPFSCLYTRTTGIWGSVWLEYAPEKRIDKILLTPNAEKCCVKAEVFANSVENCEIAVLYGGKRVGEWSGEVGYRKAVEIALSEKRLWDEGKGELYDVEVTFGEDKVSTYFGLRDVCYKGYDFLLNGKRNFLRLVLDQGYYPDGIVTAPSVEAMEKDINLALRLGFNGARLHQRVFDPRFLYLCDKAGYLVWGEFGSWGAEVERMDGLGQFCAEWTEAVYRDFNHPSIITWCPLNECRGDLGKLHRDANFLTCVYELTKVLDPSRPCVDASGGHHGYKTDLYDFHYYATPAQTKDALDGLEYNDKLIETDIYLYDMADDLRYEKGAPVNLSEYGGIAFMPKAEGDNLFSYGDGAKDGDDFVRRYRDLTAPLFKYKKLSGFCYTQLYDVEQEQNGFYFYDRSDKLTEEQKDQIALINKGL